MKHSLLALLLVISAVVLLACQPHRYADSDAVEDDYRAPEQLVVESTRSAATALLDALDADQKKQAQYDIKAPLRKDWHFIPRERQGLMLGDMDAKQKTLVHNLIQTALSDSGYLKATDIIWLESVLYEMSNQSPMRDPGKYALQIFGDPADKKAAWGWRLEGHHLSLNLTYAPLQSSFLPERIAMTPLFFGTNPAVVQQGPLTGKRILADAHNLAIKLASSMNEEQRSMMRLDKKPRDVVTGPGREKLAERGVGIAEDDLNYGQWDLLCRLVDAYSANVESTHRDVLEMQQMSTLPITISDGSKGLKKANQFYFAWAGPIDADKPFYYRIETRRFLIEYSCQGKNHVHAVMHDLTDPLQDDLLKKHFEQHEH